MDLEILFYSICCFDIVLCDHPLFIVVKYFKYTHQRSLFRRSGAPNCSHYVQQDTPDRVLFFDDDNYWKISDKFQNTSV